VSEFSETVRDLGVETSQSSPRPAARGDTSGARNSGTPQYGVKNVGIDEKDKGSRALPLREKKKTLAFKGDQKGLKDDSEVQVRRSSTKTRPDGVADAAQGSKKVDFDLDNPGSPTELSPEQVEKLFLDL
jgi:hypothetical protein